MLGPALGSRAGQLMVLFHSPSPRLFSKQTSNVFVCVSTLHSIAAVFFL